MTKNTNYLEQAAKHSDHDVKHWLRYLRKFTTSIGLSLTLEEINYLMHSDNLNSYQKAILQRAVIPGSPTHKYLLRLNQPASTPIYDAVKNIKNKENNHIDENL